MNGYSQRKLSVILDCSLSNFRPSSRTRRRHLTFASKIILVLQTNCCLPSFSSLECLI